MSLLCQYSIYQAKYLPGLKKEVTSP